MKWKKSTCQASPLYVLTGHSASRQVWIRLSFDAYMSLYLSVSGAEPREWDTLGFLLKDRGGHRMLGRCKAQKGQPQATLSFTLHAGVQPFKRGRKLERAILHMYNASEQPGRNDFPLACPSWSVFYHWIIHTPYRIGPMFKSNLSCENRREPDVHRPSWWVLTLQSSMFLAIFFCL